MENILQMNEATFRFIVEATLNEYATKWQNTAALHDSYKLYDKIADFAQIRSGDLWIDLGCGAGNLISKVKSRSDPFTIGIDNNSYSLALAAKRLEMEGHMVNLDTSHKTTISGPPFSYTSKSDVNSSYHLNQGRVNLFFDDMRNISMLKSKLEGSLADVVSFSFIGFPQSIAFENEFKLDYESGAGNRINEEDIRRSAFKRKEIDRTLFLNTEKILKPGGHMIYVTRINKVYTFGTIISSIGAGSNFIPENIDIQPFSVPKSRDYVPNITCNGEAGSDTKMVAVRFEYRPR